MGEYGKKLESGSMDKREKRQHSIREGEGEGEDVKGFSKTEEESRRADQWGGEASLGSEWSIL